jgi:hypothetical protein
LTFGLLGPSDRAFGSASLDLWRVGHAQQKTV